MHLHKYEKIWLIFGVGSLVLFLMILAYGAFWKGTHPQSGAERIDPENVEANEHFQEENLGVNKIDDGEYVVNIIASAFTFDFGTDEDGNPIDTIELPEGADVLFQITSTDVVHGFSAAGTNINMMVEPGHVSRYETTLDDAGEYTIVCNEYCGVGHHMMHAVMEVTES